MINAYMFLLILG